MKQRTYLILSFAMLIFIIILRILFYQKCEKIYDNKDDTFKTNIEKTLYLNLNNTFNLIIDEANLIDTDTIVEYSERGMRQEVINLLSSYKNNMKYVTSITFAMESGQYYCDSIYKDIFKGINDENWYSICRRCQNISLVGKSNIDGTNSGIIAVPVYYKEKFVGELGIEIDTNTITQLINDELYYPRQVIIFDSENNFIYQYSKNYQDKNDDEIRRVKFDYINGNITKDRYTIGIKIVYGTNYYTKCINVLKWFFWVIYIAFYIHILYKIYFRNRHMNFSKASAFTLTMVFFEAIICMLITISTNNTLRNFELKVLKHNIEIENDYNSDFLSTVSSIINNNVIRKYEHLNDSNEIKTMLNDLKKITLELKNENEKIISTFYIDNDGKYYNYPENEDSNVETINFEAMRKIINDSSNDEYVYITKMDDYYLYTKLVKIKDSKDKTIGVYGINIKSDDLIKVSSYYTSNENGDKVFIYDGENSLYNSYYGLTITLDNKYNEKNNEYKNVFPNFKNDKISRIKYENDFIITESKFYYPGRYAVILNADGKTKTLVCLEFPSVKEDYKGMYIIVFSFLTIMLIIFVWYEAFANNDVTLIDAEKEIKEAIQEKRFDKLNIEKKETLFDKQLKIFRKIKKDL